MDPPFQRPAGVRLRTGIAADDTARLVSAFGLAPLDARRRAVWLYENRSGAGALADRGCFVMLRTSTDGPAELCLQISPARPSLTAYWQGLALQHGGRLRIELDYDGVDRAEVASITYRGRTRLTDPQLTLLAATLGEELQVPRLTRLGPISESDWSISRAGVDFVVRRWAHAARGHRSAVDACEVSARARPGEAALILAVIASVLRGHGIDPQPGLRRLELRTVAALLAPARPSPAE